MKTVLVLALLSLIAAVFAGPYCDQATQLAAELKTLEQAYGIASKLTSSTKSDLTMLLESWLKTLQANLKDAQAKCNEEQTKALTLDDTLAQIEAQAACLAVAKENVWTFAVKRQCNGVEGNTCEAVCASVVDYAAGRLTCSKALHIYAQNLPTSSVGKAGLKAYKYSGSCTSSYCGPNYCCCSGNGSYLGALNPTPKSCKEIKDGDKTAPDGYYHIFPDGATRVYRYCDMTNGGWTRLASHTGADSCTHYGFEWPCSYMKTLPITAFGVSTNATSMSGEGSWILRNPTFKAAQSTTGCYNDTKCFTELDQTCALANFASCKTPTGTAFSRNYNNGYLYISGTLETYGSWTEMFAGCGSTVATKTSTSFRTGGVNFHTGEFIHTKCDDYTNDQNSVSARWSDNSPRTIWVS